MNICGRVLKVNWILVDKQVSRSSGIIHSKVLRILSAARSSAFPERVLINSVVSTVMNWDITGAVLGIQFLQSPLLNWASECDGNRILNCGG